jgi:hypothetical protein
MSNPTTMTPPYLSPEVLTFCQEKGILHILHNAIRLLQEAFPESRIGVGLEEYPEDIPACVVEAFVENDNWEGAFGRHQEFLKQFVRGDISPYIRTIYSPA